MHRAILVATAFGLVFLGGIAMAQGQLDPDPVCYKQQWFSVTQTSEGGCGFLYTECPGRVLCNVVPVGFKTTSAIAPNEVACKTYTGGTGTPPNCTGGTEVDSTESVTVPFQTCSEACDSTNAGE